MSVRAEAVVLNVIDARRSHVLDLGAGLRAGVRRTGLPRPTAWPGRSHPSGRERPHSPDLWVDRSSSDMETEVARLTALGAKRVEWTYPDDADFVVLADTEGNLFCVIA